MMKLRRNLVLAFVLSVALPVTVVQTLTFVEARKQTRDSFIASITGEIKQINNSFSLFFKQIEDDVRYLSQLEIVQQAALTLPVVIDNPQPSVQRAEEFTGVNKDLHALFKRFGTTHDDLAYIYLGSELHGYLQWPAGPMPAHYNPIPRPWYQRGFQADTKVVRSEAYYWAPDDASIVSTVRRIDAANGQRLGVLGMDVSLKGLTSLVQDIEYGESGFLILVEPNLNTLVDAGDPGNNFQPFTEIRNGSLASLAGRPDGSYEIQSDGKMYLATIFTSPELEWRFIGMIENSEVEQASNQLMRVTASIVLISLAIFVSAAVMFSTSISKAINRRHRMLIEARKEAEQASEAKSNFLSTVSHEIRTPLNGILGMAQLVAESKLDKEQKEQISTILTSGNTLLSIINDVLDMSKIEADALELEETTFSLKNVLSGTMTPFAMMAQEKGISLTSDPLPANLDFLIGDPVRLRQILWNLVSNAIKFTEKGGITVSIGRHKYIDADKHGNQSIMLELTVDDTGVGISGERLESIFEPFAQEDNSITRKFGGTGLGLAIVKRIVDLMGGTIGAESREGQGTCFRVSIPFLLAQEADIVSLQARKEAIETAVEKNLSILVAEDNPVNAAIARAFLEKFGCSVEIAENGRIAVESSLAFKPDLIFMDVHMPEMDGIAATRAIRSNKNTNHIPIVGLTADVFKEHHKDFISNGMNDVITKPFSEKQLKSAIVRFTGEGADDIPSEAGATLAEGSAGTTNSPIGDEEQLAQIQETLGHETLQTLMEMAPANIDKLYGDVKTHLDKGDLIETARSLHAIKGSVASLCAVHLTEKAKQLELAARAGEDIVPLLPEFEGLIEETKAWWQLQLNKSKESAAT